MKSLLYFWLGASAEEADPALVASDQAAARLAPTGVDPLRCNHAQVLYLWRPLAACYGHFCSACGDQL